MSEALDVTIVNIVQTMQQVGGALGLSAPVTVYGSRRARRGRLRAPRHD
ncbi:hypothetical protein ACH492_37145 [Streptomyces sp. NPDC019443]